MVTVESKIKQPLCPPQIKNYRSYRSFLHDWYFFRKHLRAGFSYRRFSSMLGLKSPNFIQLVINGERNLSEELALKITKTMHLTNAEANYFQALLEVERASRIEEKEKAEKILASALRKLVTSPITKLQEKVLSRWHYMLVRELVFLKNFEPSGSFVSKKLNNLITPEEGQESLELLLKLGFLKITTEGKWKASEPVIDTGDNIFTHSCMQKHHAETLITWGKNLESLNTREQELGLLHIPISSNKIPLLKDKIRKFQDEIIGWLESETEADRVVQLGTYLIPFDRDN